MDTEKILRDKGFMADDDIQSITGFIKAINWLEEPYLLGIIFLHIMFLILVFAFNKSLKLMAPMFFALLGSVAFSEYMNQLLAANWKLFVKEQYFDSKGLFISIIWNCPALIICICILVLWIIQMSSMVITVKRKELSRTQNSESVKNK